VVTTPRVPQNRRLRLQIILLIPLLCVVILAIVADREWPFTQSAIAATLQQQADAGVQIGSFRQFYLPSPGCVAENVTFRRSGDSKDQPFVTIRKLTILGSYHGLLTNHISTVQADGVHVIIQPGQTSSSGGTQSTVGTIPPGLTIGQLIADGAAIEFPPTADRAQALIFRLPKITVHDLENGKPLAFQATLQIPQPPTELDVTGNFGPWQVGRGGESKMSGAYDVKSLDLGTFQDIGGILTSKGNFDGVLQQVTVSGKVDTPKFTVSSSGHPIHLVANYSATVNGLNGDVNLDAAQVRFGGTVIDAAGSVAGQNGKEGKTAQFVLTSSQARVQDLLWMFISENKPPMTGPIIFRAKATVPPDKRPFLKKLVLQGDFGIANAQYPHESTQRTIDVLSARARGQADKVEDIDDKIGSETYDPGRVLSNIKGHVVTTDAVAHLSDVMFDVPGASAKLNGTYKLITHQVDLSGYMHLESELSKTTTGVKSVLLKVMEPFMKKGHHNESVIAIKIGGTYENPTYAVVPRAEK
jgi:hypothetical protein